jgi:hypothetical protein
MTKNDRNKWQKKWLIFLLLMLSPQSNVLEEGVMVYGDEDIWASTPCTGVMVSQAPIGAPAL